MGYLSNKIGEQLTPEQELILLEITDLGLPLQYLRVDAGGIGLEYATFPASSTGFQQPLSGLLNQSTFVWATAPNVIVVDGIPHQKVQTDGTQMWTGTTTTILTGAAWPTFDIFSPC